MQKKNIIFIVAISVLVFLASILSIVEFCYFLPLKREKERRIQLAIDYYNAKVALFNKENETLSGVQVAFIGDSLTDGYDLKHFYPEFETANRGIGGDTTFGLENRLKVSLYDLNPQTVVMLIGANNFDTMMDNYETILIKLKENLPNSNVVLLSLTAMGKEWAKNNDKAILNNQKIKLLAGKHNMTFVDLFTPLCNPETNKIYDEYTTDGGHLTMLGYQVLTNQIKPVLTNLLG